MNITGPDSIDGSEILIVDDTKANLQLLSDILSDAGYKVRLASNGELALRSVKAKLPNLILLDIKMPGMDGLEVCRQLKADEKTCAIPVIFISVLKDEASKTKGFQAGAVDFITKPFYSEEVLARVKTHLSINRLQLNLKSQNAQLLREITERNQAQEALRESALQFKSTFEQAAVGICHADPSGTFLKINQRFSEILGYSRNEIGALTWQSIIHPDDLNADLEKTQQVLENKLKTYTMEKRFLKKDGVIVWVNLTVSLVRKLDGSPH